MIEFIKLVTCNTVYLWEVQEAWLTSEAVLATVWCSVEDDVGPGSEEKRREGKGVRTGRKKRKEG